MTLPIVERWCELNDLTWFESGDVKTERGGDVIAIFNHDQNGPITLFDDGEEVKSGEPYGLKDEWMIITNDGDLYKVRMSSGTLDIDGPLPE